MEAEAGVPGRAIFTSASGSDARRPPLMLAGAGRSNGTLLDARPLLACMQPALRAAPTLAVDACAT